ncbi:MAG: hypothetical protein B7C55_12970 [Actinomycetales bacterium mxb001]|nr:MAG: hypothetical protein B7C55_12970 [Actinomycetales bacterium mxb001]
MEDGPPVIQALLSTIGHDPLAGSSAFGTDAPIYVCVHSPASISAAAEAKVLYAKAQSGTLPNMTGIGQDYEPPERPDVRLDGTQAVDDNVEVLVRRIVGE